MTAFLDGDCARIVRRGVRHIKATEQLKAEHQGIVPQFRASSGYTIPN